MMLGQTEWAEMVMVERHQEAEHARLANQVKRANKATKTPTSTSKRRRSLRRLRELPTRN